MTNQLTDKFNRKINYLRLSVTDRCDFRCLYCMSEKMTFLPRKELLTLEELQRVGEIFISLGVNKIRITGGEPLVRKDIDQLFNALGQNTHLKELTLTTNASQLKSKAPMLLESGVKRINISLDSLDRDNFKKITRTGNLDQILENIRFASGLGFKKIKLNSVLMQSTNDHEIFSLIDFALENQFDISFIEEMPLGHIEHERGKTWIDNEQSLKKIQSQYNLTRSALNTGGPAKYWHIDNSQTHIGFISPHSNNFCESCNRVRVSCKGELFLCLGQDEKIELAPLLRKYPSNDEPIKRAIINAMSIKPESHEFNLNEKQPAVIRFMSHTGG